MLHLFQCELLYAVIATRYKAFPYVLQSCGYYECQEYESKDVLT